ncbi:MAG: hypothetical protein PWQ57_122 [Desulfovibrionales bacterium]|jgi:uncharacterized protein YbaR (Trm112 family)|nr:hypothetical protein [Desulfovibrionales bacterium]
MKTFLAGLLVCPVCRGREAPLSLTARETRGDEVVAGFLDCPHCRTRHPIIDGVAEVLPAPRAMEPHASQKRYELGPALSSYLWAHFGDLAGDGRAGALFRELAPLLRDAPGPLLDAGSAVGRMVFETAGAVGCAVGVDLSRRFIHAARTMLLEGAVEFDLALEGRITEPVRIEAPAEWAGLEADFLAADAMALPFPASVFGAASSLNLLDKLPNPLRHLQELDRVAHPRQARLLVADPFSWSEDAAEPAQWLGGLDSGPYAGRGLGNLEREMRAGFGGPPWSVAGRGAAKWTLRTHANHAESITSQYLLGVR